jgi:hypothetical protein
MDTDSAANWKFATRGDGGWRWTAATTEGEQTVSLSAFTSIEDCMADAAQHGYTNYRPTEAAYP